MKKQIYPTELPLFNKFIQEIKTLMRQKEKHDNPCITCTPENQFCPGDLVLVYYDNKQRERELYLTELRITEDGTLQFVGYREDEAYNPIDEEHSEEYLFSSLFDHCQNLCTVLQIAQVLRRLCEDKK